MADVTHVLDLPDKRSLAWLEIGDPDGPPVFAFHGTPGSRRQLAIGDEPVRAAGVRLICPDRPGYGLSTYQPDRTLAGWADDVRLLADHLELARFGVVGVSGGGPHALVCARFLADQVTAAATVSGIGPIGEAGSEDGMMPVNRLLVRASRRTPLPAMVLLGAVGFVTKRWPEKAMAAMSKQVPAADRAIIERPEVREAMLGDTRWVSRTSGRAAAQDFTLFARDWGFRLEDITVPVHVWQGTDDVNVPMAHGRLQASRIPGAVFHEVSDAGHLYVIDRMGEILAPLVEVSSS